MIKNNYLILYHYTNKEINGKLSPRFFGDNGYTSSSYKLSSIKRIYFYIDIYDIEPCLIGSKYLYKAIIKEDKIYNLNDDVLRLAEKLSFNEILIKVKALKYKGIIGDNGTCDIVSLFYDIKVEKIRG